MNRYLSKEDTEMENEDVEKKLILPMREMNIETLLHRLKMTEDSQWWQGGGVLEALIYHQGWLEGAATVENALAAPQKCKQSDPLIQQFHC